MKQLNALGSCKVPYDQHPDRLQRKTSGFGVNYLERCQGVMPCHWHRHNTRDPHVKCANGAACIAANKKWQGSFWCVPVHSTGVVTQDGAVCLCTVLGWSHRMVPCACAQYWGGHTGWCRVPVHSTGVVTQDGAVCLCAVLGWSHRMVPCACARHMVHAPTPLPDAHGQ